MVLVLLVVVWRFATQLVLDCDPQAFVIFELLSNFLFNRLDW